MLVTTAYAARPKGDTRYIGKTGQGKKTIKLPVTSDGKGLQMQFRQKLKCNRDGSVSTEGAILPPASDDQAGRDVLVLQEVQGPPGDPLHQGLREIQRVTGSFSKSGRTVKGRITDSVKDTGTPL